MSKANRSAQGFKQTWKINLEYFQLQYRVWCNKRARAAGRPEPFQVSPIAKFMHGKPGWLKAPASSRRRFSALPATVKAATYAFLSILLFNLLFGSAFDWDGVTTELWGLLAEVAVLGIIIFYVGERSQTSQFVARQHELISDFKYWDSEEAKFRILGALRRLQQHGITDVNLAGVKLSSATLPEHGITSLAGATLSGGSWVSTIGIRSVSTFSTVDFTGCSCEQTKFSIGDGFSELFSGAQWVSKGNYLDCSFHDCNLRRSIFDEADLSWSSEPPEINYEHVADDDRTGEPVFQQCHFGPFFWADLSGASFKNAHFKNADFRGAIGIESCDFTGAEGLDTCLFDSADLKEQIIARPKPDANR